MMRRFSVSGLMCVLAGLLCSPVNGDSISIGSDGPNSESMLGTYTGTIDYTGTTLTITLNNTSPPANTGFIVGVVFNINDANDNATAVFVDADNGTTSGVDESDFNNASSGDLDFNPFGVFEAGAFRTGNPNFGVGVGETGIFTFNVTEPDGQALAAADFFTEISPGNGGNGKDFAFAVRFRGFDDGGSDKVPGLLPPSGGLPIPTPAAGWMGLTLLGGLIAMRHRRKPV